MAQYQAFFNAKIRVNNTAYATESVQLRDENPRQDVSNTEGIAGNPAIPGPAIGKSAFIPALSTLTATVRNACFDTLANPFAAPFSLFSGTYIALRVFLNSIIGVSWNSPSFYVESVEHTGQIRGIQPISFSGAGDGAYNDPSV